MIFLMISTSRSERYTAPSAASLLNKTTLRKEDKVIIIDNDGTLGEIRGTTVVKNEKPRSFAENANLGLTLSKIFKEDLLLLNNDIIYTGGWFEFLEPDGSRILIPFCNQNAHYACGNLILKFTMNYEDYADQESELEGIARAHRQSIPETDRFSASPLMSFYCVYIPYKVSDAIGNFDETFGRGGGEDVDYRLRALRAGIDVQFAKRSYLLHFTGKSTWCSGEPASDTIRAYDRYRLRFIEKWGQPAADFFLAGPDKSDVARRYGVHTELERGDYRAILDRLIEPNLDPLRRQMT